MDRCVAQLTLSRGSRGLATLLTLLCMTLAAPAGGSDAHELRIGPLSVAPGTRAQFALALPGEFDGTGIDTPVHVVHGAGNGPVLCLTGGVHGDEITGIEIARRTVQAVDAATMKGSVVAVPMVAVHAFRRASRYLPDRRDLNRAFPGSARGSLAARLAHRLMEQVVSHCDLLADVHSGSNRRANLPQVLADMSDPAIAALAFGLEPLVVLHRQPRDGTLRHAAAKRGVAAVVVEAGEANRLDPETVEQVVGALRALLSRLSTLSAWLQDGACRRDRVPACERASYFRASSWQRAPAAGMFIAHDRLGGMVEEGQLLGVVVNPASGEETALRSRVSGLIVGQAVNQVVMEGYGLVNVASRPAAAGDPP